MQGNIQQGSSIQVIHCLDKCEKFDYYFQQRVRFQIKHHETHQSLTALPCEYVFQWGANKSDLLIRSTVEQIKQHLRNQSEKYIVKKLSRWYMGNRRRVYIDIEQCDLIGIPGFLADDEVRPVIKDSLV